MLGDYLLTKKDTLSTRVAVNNNKSTKIGRVLG